MFVQEVECCFSWHEAKCNVFCWELGKDVLMDEVKVVDALNRDKERGTGNRFKTKNVLKYLQYMTE